MKKITKIGEYRKIKLIDQVGVIVQSVDTECQFRNRVIDMNTVPLKFISFDGSYYMYSILITFDLTMVSRNRSQRPKIEFSVCCVFWFPVTWRKPVECLKIVKIFLDCCRVDSALWGISLEFLETLVASLTWTLTL